MGFLPAPPPASSMELGKTVAQDPIRLSPTCDSFWDFSLRSSLTYLEGVTASLEERTLNPQIPR